MEQVRNLELGKSQQKGYQDRDDAFKSHKTTGLSDFNLEFKITTDTMVAKVSFMANKSTKMIWVFWGDLESDKISVYPGLNLTHSPEYGLLDSVPNRTYELLHVYDDPKNPDEFKKSITVRIQEHSGRISQFSKTIAFIP
ncbi:hypothetical protein HPE56_19690 [Maribacter sp. ANRC-HE7]|uniref:Uncharacterized protein n=1 Tax=Maribacter aquimaris TaxID=2737171 RepID=A0ABR7V5K9_9FLAO|nr:hypothetical protein [Maribacter aquimaris]MBD0780028.1 hypothetical protein [Maribacter aquimaris]